MDGLESLSLCPMVFQERMPKARELRVVHVAGKLFTGSLDAGASAGGQLDWRGASPEECVWREDALPERAARGYRALMAKLGLCFGAADFIVPPEGEPVFLEVNPAGEWGMLERRAEPAHLRSHRPGPAGAPMTVLLLTHSQDNESIAYVQEALAARGGRAFRWTRTASPRT